MEQHQLSSSQPTVVRIPRSRSKHLKSELYSSRTALSRCSEIIVASHGHIACSPVNFVPEKSNWGYKWDKKWAQPKIPPAHPESIKIPSLIYENVGKKGYTQDYLR